MTERQSVTAEQLIKAMQGEADTIAYYEHLYRMSCDTQDIALIKDIISDEEMHLRNISLLYARIFSRKVPHITPTVPHIPSFIEGVKTSILNELDTYEFYRDVYMENSKDYVKDIFYEAMTDENEHAAKFNYMFTKTAACSCHKSECDV